MKNSKIFYQIKIQLKDFRPTLSRTILIDSESIFTDLHNSIQESFGLGNYHFWDFSAKFSNPSAVQPDFHICPYSEEEWEKPKYYAEKTKLFDIFTEEKQKLTYCYDFGDSWEFFVTLQKIIPASALDKKIEVGNIPLLLKTKGPDMIEDCGGVWGFSEILGAWKALKEGKKIPEDQLKEIAWHVLDVEVDPDVEESFVEIIDNLHTDVVHPGESLIAGNSEG